MNWRRYGIAGLGFTLLMASCSGGENTDLEAVERAEDLAGAEVSATEEVEDPFGGLSNERFDTPAPSPLNDFLGVSLDGDDSDMNARIQDEIVACMAAEGFEYTPSGSGLAAMFTGRGVAEDGLVTGSEAWISRYGFGRSTQRFSQDDVGANLVGNTWGTQTLGVEDANRDYVASLSAADQAAYYEALYGLSSGAIVDGLGGTEGGEATDGLEDLAGAFSEGCEPKANRLATGGVDVIGLFFAIGNDVTAMQETVSNDPRVIEARQELAACLQARGLPYANIDEAKQDFQDRVDRIGEVSVVGGVEEMPDPNSLAGASMLDLQDMLNGSGLVYNLSDESKAELAVIQGEEVATAQEFLECGVGLQGLAGTEIYGIVQAEVEQRFVDDNVDRLSEFKVEQ